MKRLLLPLAALAIAGLLFPSVQPAYACVCAAPTVETMVDEADAIVTALVTEVVLTPSLEDAPEEIPDRRTDVVLAVDDYLQGTGPSTITLNEPGFVQISDTKIMGNDCAMFGAGVEGERYILFLSEEDGTFRDNGICAGSGSLRGADPQFLQDVKDAIANPDRLPLTGSTPPAEQADTGIPWLVVAGLSSLAGAAVLAGLAVRHLLARRGASRR